MKRIFKFFSNVFIFVSSPKFFCLFFSKIPHFNGNSLSEAAREGNTVTVFFVYIAHLSLDILCAGKLLFSYLHHQTLTFNHLTSAFIRHKTSYPNQVSGLCSQRDPPVSTNPKAPSKMPQRQVSDRRCEENLGTE